MAAPAQQGQDFAGIGKSPSLTASLERAHRLAVERSHGIVTLEHLLLSLTEDADAAAVFGVSPLNVGQLRADLGEVLKRVPAPEVLGRAICPMPIFCVCCGWRRRRRNSRSVRPLTA